MSSLKSEKSFALFVFSSILFFALFFLWITFHRGPLGNVRIERVVVCVDVDDSGVPYGVGGRFSFGIRQLCMVMDSTGGEEDDSVRLRWYYRGQLIHEEIQLLGDGRDESRMFYLLREDGAPLPLGAYEIQVDLNDRPIRRIPFAVVEGNGTAAKSQ
ncbi:MAG: hypothetical protein U9Q00_03815 [Synergistota bacterium]|nr:hypothetical protein [Synergistota bacterium]